MSLTRYEHENIKNKIDGYQICTRPNESSEQRFERAKSELLQALRLQIRQVEEFTYSDLFKKVS